MSVDFQKGNKVISQEQAYIIKLDQDFLNFFHSWSHIWLQVSSWPHINIKEILINIFDDLFIRWQRTYTYENI